MTEEEWLTCESESQMRSHLWKVATERKLRLYACACTRRVWPWVKEGGRRLIETVEMYSDGISRKEDVVAAREGVWDEGSSESRGGDWQCARQAAWYSADDSAWNAAGQSAWMAYSSETMRPPWPDIDHGVRSADFQAQCQLLRDIFGNPFRPVSVESGWVTPTVAALAQGVYDEHRFEDLPILADALEEAGCTDAAILGHLRGPGPHVRGCWVVDLVRSVD